MNLPPSIKYVDTYRSPAEVVSDAVAVEEPMEIRLAHYVDGKVEERSISITMRTPGNDEELALGFLFTEGIIHRADQVVSVMPCGPANVDGLRNVVKVVLHDTVNVDIGKLMRNFYTTSSCGVCGKSSLAALAVESQHPIAKVRPMMRDGYLHAAPDKLRAAQVLFDQTGGIHAAGLLNTSGALVDVKEDVGRHNALDKIIGAALGKNQIPLSDHAIVLSGRASFELLQKSMMAGVPLVAAVGAPSSLAVECAKDCNITLVGFLRDQSFNIYAAPERVVYT